MFRGVSSGWGCECGAHFLLWLTADSEWGHTGWAESPCRDCQEPVPITTRVASTSILFTREAGHGKEGLVLC